MDKKKTIIICCIILIVAAVITSAIFFTEPTAKRSGATKQTAMLVDVTTVKRGTFQPTIIATGTVEPEQDIILSPRVGGEIISRSPAFSPGGHVKKGDILLQIDPADYENTLQQRKSELRQATANLQIEMGRQNVAQKDYQLFDETLSGEQEALILRKPQLNAARSSVEAARAAVNQAELALQRTTIKAPFDAHILSRNANVGSQVSPGENLGRLVGMDHYWVETMIPVAKLRWLAFPEEGQPGAEVRIRNRTAWPEGVHRKGSLYKLVGSLEGQTRLARVLVTVPDPLAYLTEAPDVLPLMIGAFVEVRIQAQELTGVFRLNRDFIRQNETVWVMQDGLLRIRDVNVIFKDAEFAYITNGLNDNERVVTSNLATVVDGAPLRIEGAMAADSLSITTPQHQNGTQSSEGSN